MKSAPKAAFQAVARVAVAAAVLSIPLSMITLTGCEKKSEPAAKKTESQPAEKKEGH